ncbi:MAG: hypothetical protein CMI73_01370 [Candidatus Pelagibacter sp.]|nr:hypothetical protein [Candidatus Pelagibacter sp.]OUV87928.1 MAG: hypothetical protein CBC96_01075 [Pelagibacteraceae bacterium TMED136]|tara:strand:+ start:643 stop:1782 length:1140 start_codon:yes stop_codon:yes gene_type:complete
MSSIDIFKYYKDDPSEFIKQKYNQDQNAQERHLSNLLSHSIRISKEIFPDIGKGIEEIFEELKVENNFNFFVTADHVEANAACSVMPFSNKPDIIITSKLVELLSHEELKFVLGHEIAHYYFQHSNYPHHSQGQSRVEKLNLLNLSRAAEISSDRIGFIVCNDIETSLRAMIKLASGLGEKHINFNFSAYLDQLKELEKLGKNDGQLWSSHPNFLLRMQALIWFSMSKEYNEFKNLKGGSFSIKEIDEKIDKQINKIIGNELEVSNKEIYDRALLWGSLHLYMHDNIFTKEEQDKFKKRFGEKKMTSTVSFLKISKGNISDKIKLAFKEANTLLKKQKTNLIDELISVGKEVNKDDKEVLKKVSKFASYLNDERVISFK